MTTIRLNNNKPEDKKPPEPNQADPIQPVEESAERQTSSSAEAPTAPTPGVSQQASGAQQPPVVQQPSVAQIPQESPKKKNNILTAIFFPGVRDSGVWSIVSGVCCLIMGILGIFIWPGISFGIRNFLGITQILICMAFAYSIYYEVKAFSQPENHKKAIKGIVMTSIGGALTIFWIIVNPYAAFWLISALLQMI